MTFVIELDEATAARRRVPFKLFTSNGTSPDTGASGDSVMYSVNGGAQSDLTASVISANAGMYYAEFAQADIATLGTIAMWHDIGSFAQHVANINVVNYNPMSTLSAADVNTIQISGDAVAADNLELAFDGTGYDSLLTVFIKDSIATITGDTNTATLINALNDIDGSGVTLHAGTHSDATVQGLTRINSSVTIRDADYSAVTVRVDSSVTIAGVTNVQTQITALNDIDGSAVTIVSSSLSEVADALLSRSLAGSAQTDQRNVRNALRALRNRVAVDDSVLTVFEEDDTTSAWTGSVTTQTDPSNIVEINPR